MNLIWLWTDYYWTEITLAVKTLIPLKVFFKNDFKMFMITIVQVLTIFNHVNYFKKNQTFNGWGLKVDLMRNDEFLKLFCHYYSYRIILVD